MGLRMKWGLGVGSGKRARLGVAKSGGLGCSQSGFVSRTHFLLTSESRLVGPHFPPQNDTDFAKGQEAEPFVFTEAPGSSLSLWSSVIASLSPVGVPNTGALSKPRFLPLAKTPTTASHPACCLLTRKVREGERRMDCLKLITLPPRRVRPPAQGWGESSHHFTEPQSFCGCEWLGRGKLCGQGRQPSVGP